jgi:drug/metabolite transporter (DMT)-like permease
VKPLWGIDVFGIFVNDSTNITLASDPPAVRSDLLSDLSLLTVAIIWGVNIPFMKTGLERVDPYVFNAIRLAISTGVLVIFAFRELRQGLLPKGGVTWKQVAIYGVVAAGFYQLIFLLGIARTTSGNTALIMATVPMWTALLARGFIGERLRRLAWGGLAIALVGTILVAVQSGSISAGEDHLWGNLLILLAALLWSGGTVYSRPLLKRISPMQLSALAMVVALPLHLGAAVGQYQSSLPALQSGTIWAILIFSGVLSSGLALPMWSLGVRHAGAAHASVIQNLVPLIAIAAAWLSRGETITLAQLIGGILILGGLVIMRKAREKAPED